MRKKKRNPFIDVEDRSFSLLFWMGLYSVSILGNVILLFLNLDRSALLLTGFIYFLLTVIGGHSLLIALIRFSELLQTPKSIEMYEIPHDSYKQTFFRKLQRYLEQDIILKITAMVTTHNIGFMMIFYIIYIFVTWIPFYFFYIHV